ncbi:MAG: aconitate hydratase, partial [Chitinophagales bacterium]
MTTFAPKKNLTVVLNHSDGSTDSFEVAHTYNQAQIEWFKEGSALNLIKKQN